MRILELVNSLDFGGAEKMMIDLSGALATRGHTISVACLRHTGPLAAHLKQSDIEVIELRKKEDGFSMQTARTLAGFLKSRGTDVVHTHNPLVHHYGILGARLASVPVVVNTVHGPGNVQSRTPSTFLFELGCLFSDRVVSCCGSVEEHLKTTTVVAGRKSVVIRNGIPLDGFTSRLSRKPDGRFVFGAVGRLVPVKDHANLLEAFARVVEHRPDCRLEILGDGPLRAQLEERARGLNLSDSVRFLGAGLQVAKFLETIDSFVLSSVYEGLPLTVLEAMAAGLPIVSTSVGAVPELLGNAQCGWMSHPGNPQELAAGMLSAAAATDLRERGHRARSYVQNAHSVTGMAVAYESLFFRLLNQS